MSKKSVVSKNNTFKYDVKTEVPIFAHQHPIFCFKHIHPEYDIDQCDDKEQIALLKQIRKLSKITWQEIEYTGRHGLGSEKIAINSLKSKCPPFITKDVDNLLALRFYGKMPFLVYRDKFLAHIIFIDPKGKVYNH